MGSPTEPVLPPLGRYEVPGLPFFKAATGQRPLVPPSAGAATLIRYSDEKGNVDANLTMAASLALSSGRRPSTTCASSFSNSIRPCEKGVGRSFSTIFWER